MTSRKVKHKLGSFTSLDLARTSLWRGLLRGCVGGLLLVVGLRSRRVALQQGLAVRHGAGWRGEGSICRSFAQDPRETRYRPTSAGTSDLQLASSERFFRSCAWWADPWLPHAASDRKLGESLGTVDRGIEASTVGGRRVSTAGCFITINCCLFS